MSQSRSISHDSLDLYGKSMVEKSFSRQKIGIIPVSVETGDTSKNISFQTPSGDSQNNIYSPMG